MEHKKYEKLMRELNSYLGEENVPSLGINITKSLDIDNLTQDEASLTHALLHRFYATGTKTLSKEDIKEIHDKVKHKLSHSYFDKLDDEK